MTSVSSISRADLTAPCQSRLAELESRLESSSDLAERAWLLLRTGRHDEALREVPRLLEGGVDARVQAAAVLSAVHDYERWKRVAEELVASDGDHPGVRRVAYRWWFAVEDLGRVERVADERREAGENDLVDLLARGRLQASVLELAAAQESYEQALAEARTDEERAWALHGLGVVLHRRRDFDAAFRYLSEALTLDPLDADLLVSLSGTLIRLSRTDEAIELLELAVRLAPHHERAHYVLGNGYARKSYTQLHAAYPSAFADESGKAALARADGHFAARDLAKARTAYEELRRAHPGWADVAVRLGSLAFVERRYEEARRHFTEALGICPEYGRAHNGLAKALEAELGRYSVHYEFYERRFGEASMPEVAGIEDYVANWSSLEPRHRKVVARAVAPWRRYVPVLLEAGSTHYVKPLHQILSESPEQHLLHDARIHYDSRLWDDVRGVGGYRTVTGIEDVERIVWNGYNTVLHELTHQVHQVLPAEDRRRIQELYRKTKERDEKSGDAFLSRYAGGSVWEYFAEGANSLASPRRDRFDTREIVRARLEEKDPALLELVRELQDEADVARAFSVALISRGYDHLRKGRAEDAIQVLRRALDRAPDSEDPPAALNFALSVDGHAAEALELAAEKSLGQPESASLAISHASSLWLAGHGLDTAIATLREAREQVREEERFQLDLQLGTWAWTAGDARAARRAYETVLAYQTDHPQGLWGLASAYALAGEWESAWRRYEEAVRHRTGIVGLRTGYAADLLRAGELERARLQLDAALLLDPEDPDVLAFEALWFLESGRVEEAESKAEQALEIAPWSDWARLARAKSLIREGRADEGLELLAPLLERVRKEAPPEYVFRAEKGSYVLVHSLPALLREELIRAADPDREVADPDQEFADPDQE